MTLLKRFIFIFFIFLIPIRLDAKDIKLLDADSLDFLEEKIGPASTITEEFDEFSETEDFFTFEKENFKDIVDQKEDGNFVMPEPVDTKSYMVTDSTDAYYTERDLPEAQVELPYQTRLSISGQKRISVKYGNVYYFGDEEERTVTGVPSGTTKGFEMEQELKVRIKGQVGQKITVNVNYDDTQPIYNESARKISILYKGDPEEIIQEAAFGDITLSIPSTKFVGYSKKVFGASVKGRYKNFNFMAIGSQTKGKTEVKEFTGAATFTKKTINDNSYTRRRYYSIDLDTSSTNLPIYAGSVNIFIDDQNSTNFVENNESTMTVRYFASTQTYTGNFYKLIAGRDYYVNHAEGIVTFNRTINSNYLVAIQYKYSDDGVLDQGYTNLPVIIKDENETLNYELKNRYNLGAQKILRDDFVIKFQDLNANTITLPSGSYSIDYELGLIIFDSSTPFWDSSRAEGYSAGGFSDIYDNNSPQSHYLIYVEYNKRIKSYTLRPNIIRGSERILLDGRFLSRDNDYIIDYPSGYLTFIDENLINETTQIEATYEYMPFGGLFKETLVGMRGEYKYSPDIFIGGTMLYNWASAPLELPGIHSTPASTLVLDTDFNVKIPKTNYFPLPTSINTEIAQSIYNPNTIGKAMIDNMEGVREVQSISLVADNWQIAATPLGQVGSPDWYSLTEEDVYLSEINPLVSGSDDEKKNVLLFNFDLPSGVVKETSIVYPMSKTGLDFSDKDTIQLWLYGDGSGADLQIDFGNISEDSDSSSQMKTEDKNGNGTLDTGEDTGWNYIYENSTYSIGANNGEIDSKDLDGDGFLDTIEDYNSYSYAIDNTLYKDLHIDWIGWKRIVIAKGGDAEDWGAVKHVRLTVKGSALTGSVGVTGFEVVGNKWEIEKGTGILQVNAVNNYDNADYVTPLNEIFYEDIYEEVGGSGLDKEQALELVYTSLPDATTVYVVSDYNQGVDFSEHKKLNFLFYGEGSGVDMFIAIGAGEDFYIKRITDDAIGWRAVSISMPEDFTLQGSPNLTNIVDIRIGLINNTGTSKSGKIWVNEIYLEDPQKKIGHALRTSFSSSLPGIIDFGGTYETIDKNFQTITVPAKNQDNTSYSGNAKLLVLKFLPIHGSYSESTIITPADQISSSQYNPYLKEEDSGEVLKKSGNLGAVFTMRHLPRIQGDYSAKRDDSNFTGKTEKTQTLNTSMSYSIPLKLFVLPQSVKGTYRQTDTYAIWKDYKRVENLAGGYENIDEVTVDYTASANFRFFNRLTLQPTYGKIEKDKTWYFYNGQYDSTVSNTVKKNWPWNRAQNIGLDSQFLLMSWLRPKATYSIKINEDYNYNTIGSVYLLGGTKNVSRDFNIKGSLSLPVNKVLPWVEPFQTLSINSNIDYEQAESYKNIENEYDVLSKLDQRYELEPSTTLARLDTMTKRQSNKFSANWNPFKFLHLDNGMLNMIGNMSSRSTYNNIISRKTNIDSTYDTYTKSWPDFDLTWGKLDTLPYTKDWVKNIALRTNYSFKEVLNRSNDEDIDKNLTVKYGANCRFLFMKDYDSIFEFSKSWDRKLDLQEDHWETHSDVVSYSGQIKFTLKKYWNLIARYSQKTEKKISYSSDTPLTDVRIYTPSLKFDAVMDLPATWNIPIINKTISLMNRLKVSGQLLAEFSRSDINVDKTNTNKYLISSSADMDMSSNMRLTMSLGGQYLENIVKKENGYMSFFIQSELLIRF